MEGYHMNLGLKLAFFASIFISVALGKPNVLFIVVDDLRPALGCYDYPKILTPNIDQFARQSVVFDNAFIQQGVCGPSRTSFLTSRRPDTTRLYDFGSYWRKHAGNFTTIPQHFKQNGYFAYSIGKVFHPGISSGYFDDYPYSWSKPAYHPPSHQYWNSSTCPGADGKLYRNMLCPVNVTSQPESSLPDIQSTDQAINMLNQFQTNKTGKPFFLAVGFHKPHAPFKFPEEYLKLYPLKSIDLSPDPFPPVGMPDVARDVWDFVRSHDDVIALNLSFPYQLMPDYFHRKMRQHYYSAVSYMDSQVGKLLSHLETSGFVDNTIVSLIGDHGWSLGEHGTWAKFSNFEVVTRVPLIVYVPKPAHNIDYKKFGFIDAFQGVHTGASSMEYPRCHTQRRKALVEAVDLFPTLSELAGLKIPPTCPNDSNSVDFCTEGHSFARLFSGGEDSSKDSFKKAVFSQYPRPSDEPQRSSDLPSLEDIKIMGYTMRTDDHRYTEWVDFNPETFKPDFNKVHAAELYLHDSDPLEVYNVAGFKQYKHLQQKLRQQLIQGWRSALPTTLK